MSVGAIGAAGRTSDRRVLSASDADSRTVAAAALKAGVSRFVHISSMSVHRSDVEGAFDESVPLEPRLGDTYGRNKLLAEEAVRQVGSRGLSSIVLRPARIYGPFSKT